MKKRNRLVLMSLFLCLLLFPLSCTKPNYFTDLIQNSPIFKRGISEKERIEKELNDTLAYYERLIQQYKEAKEKTTQDMIEVQKQITVLREKIDELKKSLEQWIPQKPINSNQDTVKTPTKEVNNQEPIELLTKRDIEIRRLEELRNTAQKEIKTEKEKNTKDSQKKIEMLTNLIYLLNNQIEELKNALQFIEPKIGR